MFACFKDGEFFGIRCEDHGVAWRDWFLTKYNNVSAGLHAPRDGDNNGLCVDCVGEITGERVIIDLESAVWEWENVQSDLAFDDWIVDPGVRQRYTWQYVDAAWSDVDVSGVLFTLEECSMIKAILFDVACAFHVDGRKMPYESEVFGSIVKKVVDNTRDGGK